MLINILYAIGLIVAVGFIYLLIYSSDVAKKDLFKDNK